MVKHLGVILKGNHIRKHNFVLMTFRLLLYIVRCTYEKGFSTKNAEFVCPQERRFLLTYIVVYKFYVIFSSAMTLWYYNSPFCIRPSKKYRTNNAKILGLEKLSSA